MIRMQLRWAALLLAAGGLTAQDGGVAKGTVDYGALSAEYDSAQQAFAAARSEIMKSEEYLAARRGGDRQKAMALIRSVKFDLPGWVAKFRAGAEANVGEETAVPFLTWIALKSGDPAATRTAVAALIADHLASDRLLPLVESPNWALRGMPAGEGLGLLEQIAAGSPHAAVQAHALYYLATYTRRANQGEADAAAKADAWLARAEELAAGTELLLRIQGPRFQAERLQIGMEVPDIVGEDLDGVPFKLSDYRGKVVVIDFWGDW